MTPPAEVEKKRKSITGDGAFDMILKLKDVDEMFDLVCFGAYMRGTFNGMIPVDETRTVFKRIKELLRRKP